MSCWRRSRGLVDDILEKLGRKTPDANYKIKGGNKGKEWNELLNHGLEPNKKYLVDSRYLYETDEFGRVQRVSGKLELKPRGRNTYRQGKSFEIKVLLGYDEKSKRLVDFNVEYFIENKKFTRIFDN